MSNLGSALEYVPEITPDPVAKAEFFTSDLMKFIPKETFDDRNPLIAEKERELEERRERFSRLPIFDIQKIPPETIRKCLEMMYKDYYVKKLLEDPNNSDQKFPHYKKLLI